MMGGISRIGPCLVGLVAFVAAGCLTVAPPPATADPSPTPVITPTSTTRPEATNRSYRVRSGDTLLTTARRFGLTIGQLMAANPSISDPDRIRVGQVLVIPPPDAPDTGPRSASFTDGSDDAVDDQERQVATPGYGDITRASAELVDDRRIRIDLTLSPPARTHDPRSRRSVRGGHRCRLRGQPDYRLMYGNDVEGEKGSGGSPRPADRHGTQGDDFPGQVASGRKVSVIVRRQALARAVVRRGGVGRA